MREPNQMSPDEVAATWFVWSVNSMGSLAGFQNLLLK